MSAIAERTVRELVVENPELTRVFERLGIDYCCGGGKSLEEACRAAGVPVDSAAASVGAAAEAARTPRQGRDWSSAPLADLIDHIKSTHHEFTRSEIARLEPLFGKVIAAHGKNHAELAQIRDVFDGLADELAMHLMKEEMMLFPYIERLEEAALEHRPAMPAPFGTVGNPVRMMMQEHDSAGEALRTMRRLSDGYAAPGGACISYQTLYRALEGLEADLHQHIHLENNILFPRAIELERAQA
ncbi:MAG TPA: iron-sulfur cluster repair di-iron protein [Bryobacteraceae bacterium]|nr:iron-sulfur cluster repair di-iron protein [Bryobacteraceae bacterium]